MSVASARPRTDGRPTRQRTNALNWVTYLVGVAAVFPFVGATIQLFDLLAPDAGIDMMPTSTAVTMTAVSAVVIWVCCRSIGSEGFARMDPGSRREDLRSPSRFGLTELAFLPILLGAQMLTVLIGSGRLTGNLIVVIPSIAAMILPLATVSRRQVGPTVAAALGWLVLAGSVFAVPAPWPETAMAAFAFLGWVAFAVEARRRTRARSAEPVAAARAHVRRRDTLPLGEALDAVDAAALADLLRRRLVLRRINSAGLVGLPLWAAALLVTDEWNSEVERWVHDHADAGFLLLCAVVVVSLVAMGALRLAGRAGETAAALVPSHGPMADRATVDGIGREARRPVNAPRRLTVVVAALVLVVGAVVVTAALPGTGDDPAPVEAPPPVRRVTLPYLESTSWDVDAGSVPDRAGTPADHWFVDGPGGAPVPLVVRQAWTLVVSTEPDPSRPAALGATGYVDVVGIEGMPEAAAATNLLTGLRQLVDRRSTTSELSGLPPRWSACLERPAYRRATAVGYGPGFVVTVAVRPPSRDEASVTDDELVRRLVDLTTAIDRRGVVGFVADTNPQP